MEKKNLPFLGGPGVDSFCSYADVAEELERVSALLIACYGHGSDGADPQEISHANFILVNTIKWFREEDKKEKPD
jgi:hypothetical protein